MKIKLIALVCIVLSENTQYASQQITLLKYNDTKSVLDTIKNYVPINPVIVEAGAFDGNDTLIMSAYWPKGIIYAFEPLPEIFSLLKEKTKKRNNIHCFSLALSDYVGKAQFFVSYFNQDFAQKVGVDSSMPSLSSSLLAPKEHLTYHPEIEFKKTIEVDAVTLDAWADAYTIKKIDLLWLDLQGFELNVLKAAPVILKTVKAIYTEVEFVEAYEGQFLYTDVKAWLEQEGFMLIAQDFVKPHVNNARPNKFFGNMIFVRL